jgi:hypothetical protein
MFWAIVGLTATTVLAILFLWIAIRGGLLALADGELGVAAWGLLFLIIGVLLAGLSIWQPLHWAGVA